MQLPTAPTHSSHIMSNNVGIPQHPQHYNSYFSPASHSRPIQINAPSSAYYNPYNRTERVMGLDFEPQQQPSTNRNTVDPLYLMDFMDDENPPASSSISSQLLRTVSIGDALRDSAATALSPIRQDNKENGISSPSPPPKKEGLNTASFAPSAAAATSTTGNRVEFNNMQNHGGSGMQSFKHLSSYNDESLINEETESEAGYSGDDDCMSNCGCVHSYIGSPIDFATDNHHFYNNNSAQPFTRLGFKSIGDIIGYAQVVKAERLEALAELRNAVDKFNDMQQRKNQIQNLSAATKIDSTN